MPAALPPETREKVLVALRAGASRTGAAAAVGIGRRTLTTWLEDPDFAEACEQAEAFNETALVVRLRKAGEEAEVQEFYVKGQLVRVLRKCDWRALAWLLEHAPATKRAYAESPRVQVTGADEGPVAVKGMLEFRPDADWMAKMLAGLAELPDEVIAEFPEADAVRQIRNGGRLRLLARGDVVEGDVREVEPAQAVSQPLACAREAPEVPMPEVEP